MATDLFAKEDGLVSLDGVMSFKTVTDVVVIGSVVKVAAHVAQGLPTIQLADAGEIGLGVVVDLGNGAGVAGTYVSVALFGSAYIVKLVTAEAVITMGTMCKTAASGTVGATKTEAVCAEEHKHIVGLALQTTSTIGDEFLVLLS